MAAQCRLAFPILFVDDLSEARAFYRAVFAVDPDLDVPGMVEFKLNEGASLGLMPRAGASQIIGDHAVGRAPIGHRAELYLVLEDVATALDSALDAGAELLSPLADRAWGDRAAYVRTPQGHLLVLAEPLA